ncbi:MAG: triose-phosphate isomerase [bacterium]
MRRKIVIGNWKMNLNKSSITDLITGILFEIGNLKDIDVGIAPPFVYLQLAVDMTMGTDLIVSAQNCYIRQSGAFTGEISPSMLSDIGVKMCIVGHSERRQYFREDDMFISEKIRALLDVGISPILCVGETLDERDNGKTFSVVDRQVRSCLSSVNKDEIVDVIIAYEPVWAIGTGRNATPEQAGEVHRFIRDVIINLYSNSFSNKIRIIYGGSVNPSNAYSLMAMEDVDGALVGGASINLNDFLLVLRSSSR